MGNCFAFGRGVEKDEKEILQSYVQLPDIIHSRYLWSAFLLEYFLSFGRMAYCSIRDLLPLAPSNHLKKFITVSVLQNRIISMRTLNLQINDLYQR
mmetsp:Transcript_27164/g.37320  ORF Transcript_27164/g.37320 Transcript_27164/m.37320 type:complete len:96 (-) Transcript_27164:655-942(-)